MKLEQCQNMTLHCMLTTGGSRATRLTPARVIELMATHVPAIPGYDRPTWSARQKVQYLRYTRTYCERAGWWQGLNKYGFSNATMPGAWSIAVVVGKHYIIDGQQRRLVLAAAWNKYLDDLFAGWADHPDADDTYRSMCNCVADLLQRILVPVDYYWRDTMAEAEACYRQIQTPSAEILLSRVADSDFL